jgi:ABC-type multidrug transport system fused ATPase/permease subunit
MNEPILRGINLYIPPGRITGISGKSGSGKSTLASLLLRMHRPASGSIFINSIDINDIEKKSLTGLISIASQESEIFSASITENIILGEKFDEEKLNEICEHIGIMKFAATYPEGMNTMVMERGCNLSGGQKQRIAIARALYRNTPVLILDEATVSIDETSEQKIMQTIEWYKTKGNTVIIIAHSESTLKICDNIAVLEDGVIK